MDVTYISDLEKGEVPEEGTPVIGGVPAILGVLPVLLAKGSARPLGGLGNVLLTCLMLLAKALSLTHSHKITKRQNELYSRFCKLFSCEFL